MPGVAVRLLLELDPVTRAQRGEPQPVAAFDGVTALIVLGEPGMGKTTLLRSMTPDVISARMARPSGRRFDASKRWGIDGLDEVGVDTATVLAEILVNLEAADNPPVIIACRAQDWFGATAASDLINQYGADHVRVVALQPVDRAGAELVLMDEVPDPPAFLNEAERHGLQEFTCNPQDLILLARALETGEWPSSRDDLFGKALTAALSERNDSHRKRVGQADSLRDAAGWACAAILLSASEDTSSDGSEIGPAPHALTGLAPDKVRQALTSRVFRTTEGDRVSPSHRTVAEYCAGRWLASRVSNAREAARLFGLVTIGGAPPTPLRGVFAWIVNYLRPEYAQDWIAADPLALIAYGEPELLGMAQRADLLEALLPAVATDPDLGGWAAGEARWGVLIAPALAKRVGDILADSATPEMLKLRLLDGASHVPAARALRPLLRKIAQNATTPVGLRFRAVDAWLRAGGSEKPMLQLLRRLNAGKPGDADPTGLIRASILRGVASPGAKLVAATALSIPTSHEANSARTRLTYEVMENMSAAEVGCLIDQLAKGLDIHRSRQPHETATPVAEALLGGAVDFLVRNALEELTDARLVALHEVEILSRMPHGAASRRLAAVAQARPSATMSLFDRKVLLGAPSGLWGRWIDAFDVSGLLGMTPLVEVALCERAELTSDNVLAAEIFQLVVGWLTWPVPEADFALLYGSASRRLSPTQVGELFSRPLRSKRSRGPRQTQPARLSAGEATNLSRRLPQLAAGQDVQLWEGVGTWYAYGIEGHSPKSEDGLFTPLEDLLGQPLADDLAAALISGLFASPLPSPKQIADAEIAGEISSNHAACAAMDLWFRDKSGDEAALTAFDNDKLASLLVFSVQENNDFTDPKTGARLKPTWPERIVLHNPQLAIDAILANARPLLAAGRTHVAALYQVIWVDAFRSIRTPVVETLAEEFPAADDTNLSSLTQMLRLHSEPATVARLSAAALGCGTLPSWARARWTALAWLIDPSGYETALRGVVAAGLREAWWVIRTLRHEDRRLAWPHLSESQVALLIELYGPLFPASAARTPGIRAVDGPEEGASLVTDLINTLGGFGTPLARGELERLLSLTSLAPLFNDLQRARRNAVSGIRDGGFEPPDIRAASLAVVGGPPVSSMDLLEIVEAELRDLGRWYRTAPGNGWLKFWNLTTDRKHLPDTFRPENIARDVLVDDLRPRLQRFEMQTERLTTNDDRIDLGVTWKGELLPVEAKIEDNKELWTAPGSQLLDRYMSDYHANGVGIYLVLWSGRGRKPRNMPFPPDGSPRPETPQALESKLRSDLDPALRPRLRIVVLDLARRS